jgi:hypothetical protein
MRHLTNSPTLKNSQRRILASAVLVAASFATGAAAQSSVQGPSSSRTPYLVPAAPNQGVVTNVTAIVTTTDLVPLTGAPAQPYEVAGIMDGLGAFDNGDGTVTVLIEHEITESSGVVRRHGSTGTFICEMIVDKQTLAVISARDLIETFIDLNGVERNVANSNPLRLGRFCSGDLPAVSAFYNAATGLGTQDRIYMCGEEGPATGYAVASMVTGSEKGRAYLLRAFNVSTNGSGLTGVGAWENCVANPFAQDTTIVASTSDGGASIMNNRVFVYVGTKQATGNPVERAGLMNGTQYFVNIVGNATEIVNSTTRATNIISGTRFELLPTSGTQFSRPEDGHWDPINPRDFYFVTTDRLDTATSTGFNQTSTASGTANRIGMTRLWRLRFDDITNPLAGGVIDLVIDGSKSGIKVQMLDNMCVGDDGMIYLTEDPGTTTYNSKAWAYDPRTDTLVPLVKMDPQRWGDLVVNGGTPGAIAPYNNNKEISGVIDVTTLFPHAAGERVLLIDVQDHSRDAAVATASSVEGGQLLLMRVRLGAETASFGTSCGLDLTVAGGSAVLGSSLQVNVANVPTAGIAYMMVGLSATSWQGQPLPLALDNLGLTGCFLYQDALLDGFGACVATGANLASYSLSIPSFFGFTGTEIYLQAWAPSAASNPGGIIGSGALSVRLGF